MDLISKYLNLSEAWPGTPEWKKKHDPSYNPYDPEGKVRKALKLKPYGYRDSKPASDEDETPSQQPAMKKRGRPKKMKEEVEYVEELSNELMQRYKKEAGKQVDNPSTPSATKYKRGLGHLIATTKQMKSGKPIPEQVELSAAAKKTYDYSFDKVADMNAKNPFKKSSKRDMYTKVAKNAYQRLKWSDKKLNLPEEADHIEELKSSTMMSYKDKAKKEIDFLDKEIKNPGGFLRKGDKHIAGKMMDRRMKGVDMAANKLDDRRRSNAKLAQRGTFPYSEEVEEIEELSKSTLASYAKKATRDARIKMATGKDFERIAASSRKPAYKTAAATWERRYKGDARKREAGVEKAIDRLAKEEVELDEISSMAHAKYRSAARADIKTQSKMLDADNKAGDRIQKRVDGLARSTGLERVKKMTKEEVVQKYLNVEQTDNVPFKADKPKQSAIPGKYGAGYSTARHLARMGLKAAIKDLKKGPEAGKKQVS